MNGTATRNSDRRRRDHDHGHAHHGGDGVPGLVVGPGGEPLHEHGDERGRQDPPEHDVVDDVGHRVGEVVGVGQAQRAQRVGEGEDAQHAGGARQRRPHRHDGRGPAQPGPLPGRRRCATTTSASCGVGARGHGCRAPGSSQCSRPRAQPSGPASPGLVGHRARRLPRRRSGARLRGRPRRRRRSSGSEKLGLSLLGGSVLGGPVVGGPGHAAVPLARVTVWAPRRLLPRHSVRPHQKQQDEDGADRERDGHGRGRQRSHRELAAGQDEVPVRALAAPRAIWKSPEARDRHVDVDGIGGVVERAQRREAGPPCRALHLRGLADGPGHLGYGPWGTGACRS